MPPPIHYRPKVCIIRQKKIVSGQHQDVMTKHILVSKLGSQVKKEADKTFVLSNKDPLMT